MRPPPLQALTWATILGAVLSALWLASSDGGDGLPALGSRGSLRPVSAISSAPHASSLASPAGLVASSANAALPG